MMRSPAPWSLPELTRWTLPSSTLIAWLRLRSTKSSTKSAPERRARLITLSTRAGSISPARLSRTLGVAVKSDDPENDGVERHHDGDEAGRGNQRGAPAAPGAKPMGVKVNGVDHPCDGCPGLLRIPAPPPS